MMLFEARRLPSIHLRRRNAKSAQVAVHFLPSLVVNAQCCFCSVPVLYYCKPTHSKTPKNPPPSYMSLLLLHFPKSRMIMFPSDISCTGFDISLNLRRIRTTRSKASHCCHCNYCQCCIVDFVLIS